MTDDFDSMLRKMITGDEPASVDDLHNLIRRKARLAGEIDAQTAGLSFTELVAPALDRMRQENVALELMLKALATRRQKG